MKMTPEQKAFFEYGKARGIANERLGILNDATIRTNIEYGALDRKEYKELYDIDEAIRDAWEKRTACRRKCGQCAHFSPDEWGIGKDGCLKRCCGVKSNRCATGCRYWKPRKEGE